MTKLDSTFTNGTPCTFAFSSPSKITILSSLLVFMKGFRGKQLFSEVLMGFWRFQPKRMSSILKPKKFFSNAILLLCIVLKNGLNSSAKVYLARVKTKLKWSCFFVEVSLGSLKIDFIEFTGVNHMCSVKRNRIIPFVF